MRKLKFGLLILVSIGIFSCNKETPLPPHPIVGNWLMNGAFIRNVPLGYEGWEGQWISNDNLGFTKYSIEFVADNSFNRRIDFTIPPIYSDIGSWTLESDIYLTINSDESIFPEEYTLDGDITDVDMKWNENVNGSLIPDYKFDSLTNIGKTVNDLTQEEYNSLWVDTQFIIQYYLERQ